MANKSILLVDDEEIILNSIRADLRNENYDVTLATSGEEAIAKFKEDHFDLIITDLVMSGVDGINVLKEAKKSNPEVCVIILTGFGDMASAIDALRSGADDYLLKPCDTDELSIRINRCLKSKERDKRIQFYEKFLPICATCKSIRDDRGKEPGKGEWFSIEQFLDQEGNFDMTHGICPVCYKKHKKQMEEFEKDG